MDVNSKVSIVGCGWYGWPLSHYLQRRNFTVKGSKSTHSGVRDLELSGIEGYFLHLDPEPVEDVDLGLFDAEILIVNIPPRRCPNFEEHHLTQMLALQRLIHNSTVSKVLFISSTSVYPNVNRRVTELDRLVPDNPRGRLILEVENIWRDDPRVTTTILRFGGLVGSDRKPGRFLAGARDVKNGDAPVNLIHLDDCLALTYKILSRSAWGQTFNACSPQHPTRRAFYHIAAKQGGFDTPTFSDDPTMSYKIVDSSLVVQSLGYTFTHPDPMTFPDLNQVV